MRKHISRQYVSIALMLVIGITACSPATLANYAEKVGKYAVKTKPLFKSLIDSGNIPAGNLLSRIDQLGADAQTLANALRTSDNATTLQATADVINALETLINEDAELIKNPQTKTRVIGFLTAAEIAVGIITDSFPALHHATYLTPQQKDAVETIKKFKARVKCRVVGRGVKKPDGSGDYPVGTWAKMVACKEYPDQTVVEHVKGK